MKKKRVHFYTFGCKINIYDTEIMKDKFIDSGYEIISEYTDDADVVVINSCTVTAKADRKFRDYVKKVKKLDSSIIIAAVGCYTQLETDKILSNDLKHSLINSNLKKNTNIPDGINIILGSNNKFEIVSYVERFLDNKNSSDINSILEESLESTKNELKILHTNKTEFYDYNVSDFKNHTRAFLKVQDGCDNFCTYCTIPKVRGRSRGKPLKSILLDTKNLVRKGYKEIVISGIDLGSYTYFDEENKIIYDLEKLLIEMLQIKDYRIRISSIEPWCLTDELINLLISNERIVPHFHIPLQSGSDKILKKMNRKYDTVEFKKVIDKLSKKSNEIFISTDIIVGFPFEDEKDFQDSVDFLEKTNIWYAHIFSYSDRPYAASTKLKGKVQSKEIKLRSKRLHEVSDKKRFSFYNKCINYLNSKNEPKLHEVIVEKITMGNDEKLYHGFTENYIPVKFSNSNEEEYNKGDLVKNIKLIDIDIQNNLVNGISAS